MNLNKCWHIAEKNNLLLSNLLFSESDMDFDDLDLNEIFGDGDNANDQQWSNKTSLYLEFLCLITLHLFFLQTKQ